MCCVLLLDVVRMSNIALTIICGQIVPSSSSGVLTGIQSSLTIPRASSAGELKRLYEEEQTRARQLQRDATTATLAKQKLDEVEMTLKDAQVTPGREGGVLKTARLGGL